MHLAIAGEDKGVSSPFLRVSCQAKSRDGESKGTWRLRDPKQFVNTKADKADNKWCPETHGVVPWCPVVSAVRSRGVHCSHHCSPGWHGLGCS